MLLWRWLFSKFSLWCYNQNKIKRYWVFIPSPIKRRFTLRRKIWVIIITALIVSACQNRLADPYEVVYSMASSTASPQHSIEENSTNKKYKIAIVPKGIEIPYFKFAAEGAQEAAKELGVEVLFEGPVIANAQLQVAVIEELIDKRVDLIAISANDPVMLVPVLQKAMRQGIKVITWDADTEPEGRQFFVNMVEPETLGRHLMDTVSLAMGEKGKFAIMTGSLSAANLNEWMKWIKVQQTEFYPEMELVEIAATDDDLIKAYDVAKQLLEKYPDLGGILGNSSVGPPGAAKAVNEAGRSGEVKVVGLSNPNLMNKYLKDGSAQMATLWSPKKLGYLTTVLAYNLLEGEMPSDSQEIYNVGKIRLNGDMVIMGEPLDFTKDNVDQYDF
jgi:rhamnose transport system substrate-binding protein